MAPCFTNDVALQSTSLRPFNPSSHPFFATSSELQSRFDISKDDHPQAYDDYADITNTGDPFHRCTSGGYTGHNAELSIPRGPPGCDYSRFSLFVEQHPKAMLQTKCHLLCLPKELRLEIWTYVLTDPSVPNLAVEIARAPLSPSKSSLRFPTPCLKASLHPARNASIGLSLLRTNKFVYEEALPLLYHSAKFAPLDLQGIFPLFLDTLSPYGRSLIRHVKLRIPSSIYDIDLFGDPSTCLFHWAVTCAQVAKVENLRDVEVEGFEDHESKRVRNGILNPLVKMKASKIFAGTGSERAQVRLAEAQAELLAQASARKLSTEAERAAREAQIAARKESSYAVHEAIPDYPGFTYREAFTLITPESTIERGLSSVKGLAQFKRELDEHARDAFALSIPDEEEVPEYTEWDFVSISSGASTPKLRAASLESERSVEYFLDTASTLVDECDADSVLIIDRDSADEMEVEK